MLCKNECELFIICGLKTFFVLNEDICIFSIHFAVVSSLFPELYIDAEHTYWLLLHVGGIKQISSNISTKINSSITNLASTAVRIAVNSRDSSSSSRWCRCCVRRKCSSVCSHAVRTVKGRHSILVCRSSLTTPNQTLWLCCTLTSNSWSSTQRYNRRAFCGGGSWMLLETDAHTVLLTLHWVYARADLPWIYCVLKFAHHESVSDQASSFLKLDVDSFFECLSNEVLSSTVSRSTTWFWRLWITFLLASQLNVIQREIRNINRSMANSPRYHYSRQKPICICMTTVNLVLANY